MLDTRALIRAALVEAFATLPTKLETRVLASSARVGDYLNDTRRVLGEMLPSLFAREAQAMSSEHRDMITIALRDGGYKLDDFNDMMKMATDKGVVGGTNALLPALLATYVFSNKQNALRALNTNATVALWTNAPKDYDGFGAYRTGEFVDFQFSLYSPIMRLFEVHTAPENVKWQTERYRSGGNVALTASELAKEQEATAKEGEAARKTAVAQAKLDDVKRQLKALGVDVILAGYGAERNYRGVWNAPEDLLNAWPIVERAYAEIGKIVEGVSGWPAPYREISNIYDSMKYRVENAKAQVVEKKKAADHVAHNRGVLLAAVNFAKTWMRDNGVREGYDLIWTPRQIYRFTAPWDRHHTAVVNIGNDYAILAKPNAIIVHGFVIPAVGRAPLLTNYVNPSMFVHADFSARGAAKFPNFNTNAAIRKILTKRYDSTRYVFIVPFGNIVDDNFAYLQSEDMRVDLKRMPFEVDGMPAEGAVKSKITRAINADKYIVVKMQNPNETVMFNPTECEAFYNMRALNGMIDTVSLDAQEYALLPADSPNLYPLIDATDD